jgi:hypothetical protein
MRTRQIRPAQIRAPEIGTSKVARDRSNLLKSGPRRPARDKSGISSCFARHSFHTVAPRASITTCSSFAIFHPCQPCGELRSAVAVRSIEMSLRQAFGTIHIGIRQDLRRRALPSEDTRPANRHPAATPRPGTHHQAGHHGGRQRPALHDEIRRHAGSPCGGRPR